MPDDGIGKEEDAPESVAEQAAERDADAEVTIALVGAVPLAAGPERVLESEAQRAADEESVPAEASHGEIEESVVAAPVEDVTVVLERKHSLAIRWMHWINFPVLFTMIWSGLLIYWNDSIPPYAHSHEFTGWGLGTGRCFGSSLRGFTQTSSGICGTCLRRVWPITSSLCGCLP